MVHHFGSQAMFNALSLICKLKIKKRCGCSRKHTNEIISLPNSLSKNINTDVTS